ncbi:MAG: hypothetical protein RSB38_00290 [Oscillospiraceae bacterium]
MYLDRMTDGELSKVLLAFEMSVKAGTFMYGKIKNVSQKNKQQVMLEQLKQYTQINPFTFKADKTDLSYFWRNKELSNEAIEAITDKDFRNKVIDNFKQLIKEGYITFEKDKNIIVLTDKGKDYIYSEEFIKRVMKSDVILNDLIIKGLQSEQERRKENPVLENNKFIPKDPYASGIINFNDMTMSNENELFHEVTETQELYDDLYYYCPYDELSTVQKNNLSFKECVPELETEQFIGFKPLKVTEKELNAICSLTNKDFTKEMSKAKEVTALIKSGKTATEAFSLITTGALSIGTKIANEAVHAATRVVTDKIIK